MNAKTKKKAMQITQHVCDEMLVPISAVMGARRQSKVAWTRMIAIYAINFLTDISPPEMAALFRRTPGTVWHSVRSVQDRYATEREFAATITKILESCRRL